MQRSKKQSYSITLGLSTAGRAVHRSESGHSMSELGLNSAGDSWGGPLARVRIAPESGRKFEPMKPRTGKALEPFAAC
jgi:hypothetical protein